MREGGETHVSRVSVILWPAGSGQTISYALLCLISLFSD